MLSIFRLSPPRMSNDNLYLNPPSCLTITPHCTVLILPSSALGPHSTVLCHWSSFYRHLPSVYHSLPSGWHPLSSVSRPPPLSFLLCHQFQVISLPSSSVLSPPSSVLRPLSPVHSPKSLSCGPCSQFLFLSFLLVAHSVPFCPQPSIIHLATSLSVSVPSRLCPPSLCPSSPGTFPSPCQSVCL